MYLKSLEIGGFKSFAKKSSLEFTTPITAIVGPNGSGKSNVAEGFRFALGEQSMKSMRGKRGEDLIFNGGAATGGKLNRASVKLTFDNRKRLLNIDFDEVTIERVVHRDSSNEYLVNGSPVRLKDIIELLAGAHIGASGHHIISQGEADRILTANIKERREMIEDALGLKIYQYKKQESERKLEKTEENRKQVESLRKELAPHLKFLKKQVEKVEKMYEMKEQLRKFYKEYFKREEIYVKATRAGLEEEKKAPLHELKVFEGELAKAKEILAHSKGKDVKSVELIELEERLNETRFNKDLLTRDAGRIEGEIASLGRVIKREKALAEAHLNKTVYLKDVEDLARVVDAEIEGSEKESDITKLRALFVRVRDIVRKFIVEHKAGEASSTVALTEAEIEKLSIEKIEVDKKAEALIQVEAVLNKQYALLKTNIEKEKDVNRDAEKDIFRIMARQNELHGILNSLKIREEKLTLEEEEFKRELQEAMILAGREALDFHNHSIAREDGATLLPAEILAESRRVQEERRKAIEKIKIRLEDSGAGNSDEIMKEHKETEERDQFLARELQDLETSALSLKQLIKELDDRLTQEFKSGIEKINHQFQNFFALMFGGGTASLQVIREKKRKHKEVNLEEALDDEALVARMDEEVEGNEGVEIQVNLPRKKIKGLEMLSGGERALTSIALLFAISQVNPPPFIILDETDAALDEANSRKYGDMVANLARYSQLILITHNRETMSRAGVLYGVTMGSDGASKLLSISFEEGSEFAK